MAASMNVAKGSPLYQQIFEEIKTEIDNGKYVPKERIPSEPDLAEKYGVSRITVRRAIEELCAEGYLIKQQGRGTFVSTPHINRKFLQSQDSRSFSEICGDYGMIAGAHLLNRQIVPVRPDEASFFGIDDDALLLYIQRLRTADEMPIFEENIFLPYEGNQELFSAPLEDVSIFDLIERVGGRRPSRTARRVIEAVKANSEQAQRLAISIGDPLLLLNVQFLDSDGGPVCIGRQYYVGSRYHFEL